MNTTPDRTQDYTLEPGLQRARSIAQQLRQPNETTIAAKRTNAGLAAMRTLRRHRRRLERGEAPAFEVVWQGLTSDHDWPEP